MEYYRKYKYITSLGAHWKVWTTNCLSSSTPWPSAVTLCHHPCPTDGRTGIWLHNCKSPCPSTRCTYVYVAICWLRLVQVPVCRARTCTCRHNYSNLAQSRFCIIPFYAWGDLSYNSLVNTRFPPNCHIQSGRTRYRCWTLCSSMIFFIFKCL